MRNPYSLPVKTLFARLVVLKGTLQHFDVHLRSAEAVVRTELRKNPATQMGAGTALIIRDLTEWPSDGWAVHYSGGAYVRQGQQYFPVLKGLRTLSCGWVAAQGFEVFESSLQDLVARYIRRHSDEFGHGRWKPSRKGTFRVTSTTRTAELEGVVRLAFRGTEDLLPRLRRALPPLRDAELRNNRAINLVDWFKAASTARHALVHNAGLIGTARFAQLAEPVRAQLRESFPGRTIGGAYRIALPRRAAEEVLDRYAEYGALISKALSEADGSPWAMPDGKAL